MLIGAALLAGVCAAPLDAGSRPDRAVRESLCDADETPMFSCAIRQSAKMVALCARPVSGAAAPRLRYLFGAPGKPELSFPSDGQDTASAFRYSRYVRAGVSRHAVWFRNGAFEYAVFADSNSESGRLERKYGVSVSAAGGVAPTRTLACRTGKVVNRMPDLEGLIPCQGQGADPALGCS